MGVTGFISGKLRFRGKLAVVSIALSFLVMIVAVSVSSGFRKEIRDAVSSVAGDVRLMPSNMDWLSGNTPVGRYPAYLRHIDSIPGVASVYPVAYRAGIVRNGDVIHGVIFKGREGFRPADSLSLAVSIPYRLASILSVREGDTFQAYFVGERVKVRKFTVAELYQDLAGSDDRLVVYAGLPDLQRINGWTDDQVSAFEVRLDDRARSSEASMSALSTAIGAAALLYSSEDDASVVSVSAADSEPQIFNWLSLIDFNAVIVLALMTVVAGFNMISGLLILLFENISTIGILKSMGMTDKAIVKVFLRSSSSLVLKGMAAGNILAVLFCIVQKFTRFIRLDPDNYFISYVPVHLEIFKILAADAAAYLVIMLLLLLPSMFISRIDPARTVRMG